MTRRTTTSRRGSHAVSGVRDLFRRKATPEPEEQRRPGLRACATRTSRFASPRSRSAGTRAAMLPLWVQLLRRPVRHREPLRRRRQLRGRLHRRPAVRRASHPADPGGKFESTRMGFVAGLGAVAARGCTTPCCSAMPTSSTSPTPTATPGSGTSSSGRTRRRAIGALGLNVVHDAGVEQPLDLSRPVLGQRQLAKFLPLMCKPAIKFVTSDPWYAASHGHPRRRTPWTRISGCST